MHRRLSFAVLAFAALTACSKTEKQQAAAPPPPPPTRLTVADSGINAIAVLLAVRIASDPDPFLRAAFFALRDRTSAGHVDLPFRNVHTGYTSDSCSLGQ